MHSELPLFAHSGHRGASGGPLRASSATTVCLSWMTNSSICSVMGCFYRYQKKRLKDVIFARFAPPRYRKPRVYWLMMSVGYVSLMNDLQKKLFSGIGCLVPFGYD